MRYHHLNCNIIYSTCIVNVHVHVSCACVSASIHTCSCMACRGSSKKGDTTFGSGEVLIDLSINSGEVFFFFWTMTEEMSLLFWGEGCVLFSFRLSWGLEVVLFSLDPLEFNLLLPRGLERRWTGEPSLNMVRNTLVKAMKQTAFLNTSIQVETVLRTMYMYIQSRSLTCKLTCSYKLE